MDDILTRNVNTDLKFTKINYKTSQPLNILNTGCDKKCLTVVYGCILFVALIVLTTSIWMIHRRKQRKTRRFGHAESSIPKLGRRREKFPNETSGKMSGVLNNRDKNNHQQIPPSKSSGRRFSWYRPASIFDREQKLSRISEKTEPSTSVINSSTSPLDLFTHHQSTSSVFSSNNNQVNNGKIGLSIDTSTVKTHKKSSLRKNDESVTLKKTKSLKDDEKITSRSFLKLFRQNSKKVKNVENLVSLDNRNDKFSISCQEPESLLVSPRGSGFRNHIEHQIEQCRESPVKTHVSEDRRDLPHRNSGEIIFSEFCGSPEISLKITDELSVTDELNATLDFNATIGSHELNKTAEIDSKFGLLKKITNKTPEAPPPDESFKMSFMCQSTNANSISSKNHVESPTSYVDLCKDGVNNVGENESKFCVVEGQVQELL